MVLWRKQITTQARISKIAAIMLGLHAGIAQLVERNLAKVEVASSRLVSRSSILLADVRPRTACQPQKGTLGSLFSCAVHGLQRTCLPPQQPDQAPSTPGSTPTRFRQPRRPHSGPPGHTQARSAPSPPGSAARCCLMAGRRPRATGSGKVPRAAPSRHWPGSGAVDSHRPARWHLLHVDKAPPTPGRIDVHRRYHLRCPIACTTETSGCPRRGPFSPQQKEPRS